MRLARAGDPREDDGLVGRSTAEMVICASSELEDVGRQGSARMGKRTIVARVINERRVRVCSNGLVRIEGDENVGRKSGVGRIVEETLAKNGRDGLGRDGSLWALVEVTEVRHHRICRGEYIYERCGRHDALLKNGGRSLDRSSGEDNANRKHSPPRSLCLHSPSIHSLSTERHERESAGQQSTADRRARGAKMFEQAKLQERQELDRFERAEVSGWLSSPVGTAAQGVEPEDEMQRRAKAELGVMEKIEKARHSP
jgi:hypothetical protein